MNLSKTQIKRLRAESQRLKLKPVVTIGQNGLSENVQNEIDSALGYHELVKIRIPSLEKSTKGSLTDSICIHHQASLVQAIGHVIVLYRPNDKVDRFGKLLKD
ncbi:MAG: YhbY family RNA-binding protein [Gammaproteobacteria bacterium]